MKYLVKRAFPYSENGIQATTLNPGEVHEIRSDLAPGLLAEGFIERTEEVGEEAPAEDAPDIEQPEEPAEEDGEETPATSEEAPAEKPKKGKGR